MPNVTIRYSLIFPKKVGLTTVGYNLVDGAGTTVLTGRGTAGGVHEVVAVPGKYSADLTHDSAHFGSIHWDTGEATPLRWGIDINPVDVTTAAAGVVSAMETTGTKLSLMKAVIDIFSKQSYAVTVVTPTSAISMTVSGMPAGFTPLNGFAQFQGPTVSGVYLVTGFTAGSPATLQFGGAGATAPLLAPLTGETIQLLGRRF